MTSKAGKAIGALIALAAIAIGANTARALTGGGGHPSSGGAPPPAQLTYYVKTNGTTLFSSTNLGACTSWINANLIANGRQNGTPWRLVDSNGVQYSSGGNAVQPIASASPMPLQGAPVPISPPAAQGASPPPPAPLTTYGGLIGYFSANGGFVTYTGTLSGGINVVNGVATG